MANISDLNSLARYIVDADSTSLTAANLLIFINNAYEDIVGRLIVATSSGDMHFGDSNYTATPTGLVTLVNGQRPYQLTGNSTSTGVSTTTPLLNFLGASVLDNTGIWHPLRPISLAHDILGSGIDPAEYFKTSGQPIYYEKREDFIILYPAPDNGVTVTLASGLKIFFQRTADLFTSAQVTTGTKVPGFASPYHPLLAYKASLPYARKYKPQLVSGILLEIARLEKDLIAFYSKKLQDERPIMMPRKELYL